VRSAWTDQAFSEGWQQDMCTEGVGVCLLPVVTSKTSPMMAR